MMATPSQIHRRPHRQVYIYIYIAGLQPQIPHDFARQPSGRFSQTLSPSYTSHVTAAAT
jgi:hypothetical protein